MVWTVEDGGTRTWTVVEGCERKEEVDLRTDRRVPEDGHLEYCPGSDGDHVVCSFVLHSSFLNLVYVVYEKTKRVKNRVTFDL